MNLQEMTKLKLAEQMPGRYGMPFFGEIFELFSAEELFYWRRFRRYGLVFKTSVIGMKYAFLIGPDANRLVLMEQADCFSSRMGW